MGVGKYRAGLILSMIIYGTIGLLRKFIPLPSSVLAWARAFIGMLFLLALVAVTGKRVSIGAIKSNIRYLLPAGALLGFNWILLFEAYKYTTVATATLCYYMAPVIIIALSPFLFGEKLTARKAACVAVALAGMVLVSGVTESGFGGTGQLRGVLLGFGAALMYAAIVMLNRNLKGIGAYDRTIVQLLVSAILLVPYILATEDVGAVISRMTPAAAVMTLIAGIVHTGIAYSLYFGCMNALSMQSVALLSYIDPVVAVLLSYFVLQEDMSVFGAVGAALVIGALLVSEMPEGKQAENRQES